MRSLATNIIKDIIKNKTFFTKTDDAFVNMLVLTALRNLIYVEKVIKTYSKKKSKAHYVLITAITETLYLNTPDYAIINSYVDICKKEHGKFMANFANAVLRKVSQNKEELQKQDNNKFFTNQFLTLLKGYDKKTIKQMEAGCKVEPKTNIVYKDGKQKLIEDRVENIEGYTQGHFWVQDISSAQPVLMLDDIKGKKVLDLCSAPGGKSAQLLSKGANVTCLDISAQRLETLKENLNRLNLTADNIICQDAIDYLSNYNDSLYDIILLDAPCSATGTLRRHPEVVYSKDINDAKKMAEIQNQIISLCDKALKKGGILLYCTCSLSMIEGEDVIKNFLSNQNYKELQQKRIIPNINQDGFFISKLEKL